MILEIAKHDNYAIAVISENEASLQNADKFRDEMMQLVNNGVKNIVLSFERVRYVDSSFLGSLVASLKHAIANGSDIHLVNLQKDIYDLLHLIRMNKVFKIYDSAEQAIATLK